MFRKKNKNKVKEGMGLGEILYTNFIVLNMVVVILAKQKYDEYTQNKKSKNANN